jgi:pimeloyl-ACP methyl ester carboxylesterase
MTLHIETTGNRAHPTLVFLHGMSVSSWMWTEQVAALKDDYYCVAVDLPGNGESYQTEWVSFPDAAAQVAQVIRDCSRTGTAHLIGLSLGAYVAMDVLRFHPQVVESVLVSGMTTRPLPNPRLMKAIAIPIYYLQKFRPVTYLFAKMMGIPNETIPLIQRDSRRLKRETVNRVYDTLLHYTLSLELAGRTQRVLAVAGDREQKAITETLHNFTSVLPNAVTALAPKGGHGWVAEHPALFAQMIRAWVTGGELPRELGRVGA